MKSKLSFATAVLAVLLLIPTISTSTNEESETNGNREMLLIIGQQRVLESSRIASFSESTRGIIEVKIPQNGRKMVITAISQGQTSLLLINKNGEQSSLNITVFSQSPDIIKREIKELLNMLPGVYLKQIGPRIFIDGTVLNESGLKRVKEVALLYPRQVLSLVRLDSEAVKPRTNIRLDLTFLETRSSSRWGAGVNWPGQIGGTQSFDVGFDFFGGTTSASYKVVNQALPFIEAAAEYGYAKIKKKASLITTNGNRALYSAGGEVNIAVAGSQAAEIRSVAYGCKLSVLPHLDPGPGILDLEVEAEVSELTETSQNVPGRTISKIKTLVHLSLGQSIILSGLDSNFESKSKSGLPGLSRIPIFGMFFGVHKKREEQVNGLIAITPIVLDNIAQENGRLLEETISDFEDFKG